MKILEILLPKGTSDRSLPPGDARKIGLLQQRMDSYVDKIMSPATSAAGREFLKSRLRDDYLELKGKLPRFHAVAEEVSEKYEVYDKRTGYKVAGPYSNMRRASHAADKKDLEYGAVRYGYRPTKSLTELFQGGNQWEWEYTSDNEVIAKFRIDKIEYQFSGHAHSNDPTFWEMEFRVKPESYTNRRGAPYGVFGVTGTGNSSTVFSTVVDIMKNFLHHYPNVTGLSFSANEPSRKKLYRHMISRLLPKWDADEQSGTFLITKPVKNKQISEAVHKLPISHKDFDLVKELMMKPIPAAIAPIYIQEIIEDDEFNDQLLSLEDSNPDMDVRPLIVEWFKRVMPDQMYRFTGDEPDYKQQIGLLSPIHGYDPRMYRGTNDPISGNAFGRR